MNRQQTLYRSVVAVATALLFGGCVSITYTGVPPSSDAPVVRTGTVASNDCDCRCARTNVYGWYPAGEYPDPRYTGGYPVRYPYYGPYGWIPDYRYGGVPRRSDAGQPTAPPADNRGDTPTGHGYASGPRNATPPKRTGEPINGRSVNGTVEPRRDVPTTSDPNRGPSVGGGTHGDVVILVPTGDTNSARTGNPRTPVDGGTQGGRVAVDGRPRRTDEGPGPAVRAGNPTPTVRPTTPTPTPMGGSTGIGAPTARTANPSGTVRPTQGGTPRQSGQLADESSAPQPTTRVATPRAAEPRVSEPTPRPATATPSGNAVINTRSEGAASQARRERPVPVSTPASAPKGGNQTAAPAAATVPTRRGTAEVEHTAPTSGSGARNVTDAPPTSAARSGSVQGGGTASGAAGTASAPR